jgi:hypothetical protein
MSSPFRILLLQHLIDNTGTQWGDHKIPHGYPETEQVGNWIAAKLAGLHATGTYRMVLASGEIVTMRIYKHEAYDYELLGSNTPTA